MQEPACQKTNKLVSDESTPSARQVHASPMLALFVVRLKEIKGLRMQVARYGSDQN